MNKRVFALSSTWIAALLVATPALGQLLEFPVYSLPAGDADGATFAGVTFARGINDNSGKQNAFGGGIGRAMERVSFIGLVGYVASETEEVTLGANVALNLPMPTDSPIQLSVQGGVGWASIDGIPDNTTWLSVPVGLVLQTPPSDAATQVRPWVMPRYNFRRASTGGTSLTDRNFGASAGVSVNTEAGIGFHVAFDLQREDPLDTGISSSAFVFGAGVHYRIGS